MSKDVIQITPELGEYIRNETLREPEILQALRKETSTMAAAGMQISAEQGQFLRLLLQVLNARRIIEIGVFTGYSTLNAALALPQEGEVIACDVSAEWSDIARRYWQEAGVDQKITLHLAPAAETLNALLENGRQNSFDYAFVDADKDNYDVYYEQCYSLLRPGGVMAIDNVLWHGAVIEKTRQDADTRTIRAINRKAQTDERFDTSLVPVGDGILLLRKR